MPSSTPFGLFVVVQHTCSSLQSLTPFGLHRLKAAAMLACGCLENQQTKEIIALDRQETKQHRLETPTVTPPGTQVNYTRYINSTTGVSSCNWSPSPPHPENQVPVPEESQLQTHNPQSCYTSDKSSNIDKTSAELARMLSAAVGWAHLYKYTELGGGGGDGGGSN